MPRDDIDFDAVIVGAGPAGSWAAIGLVRAGRSVLLLDKSILPRAKVCGGCLSGSATNRLRGMADGATGCPGVEVTRIEFQAGDYRLVVRPGGASRMASRLVLDHWLAGRAAEAGAQVRFGEAARLERGSAGWMVRLQGQPIKAKHVLLACGLGRVPRELGIRNRSRADAMVAHQWVERVRSGLPAVGQVELHWLRGGYLGMATPDSDGCVLALAVDRRVVDGHGPLEGLRRLNPQAAIWERLQSGVGREGAAKGAAAFPWLPDRLGNGNVLLIGDAAGYAEPFSGTGMAQAMFSAECATKAIVGAGDALRNYQRLMRRHRRALWKTLVLSALLRGRLARAALSRRFAPAEPWLARCVERVHVHGGL